ncbi:MAG: TraB/GumN family protein [Burkholderiales bacterium]|nr:TraB/GumN family protein [Burkholderiales bacterium]
MPCLPAPLHAPPAARRWAVLRRLAAALLATLALVPPAPAQPAAAAPAPADANCPPAAQAPTAEQIQRAVREARDRGFLWRISKNGRASYLYGTIHVGRLAWAVPGPHVRHALQATQALALELDLGDERVLEQLSAPDQGGPPAPQMPASWQQRLQRQAAAACVPAAMLAPRHPLLQAVMLTVLAARWDGLDPAFAQEFALGGIARASAKPVVSLETPARQLAALMPADADRARLMAEQTMAQLEQGRARATLLRVAQAWERGDLDELAQYERWCECIENEDDARYMRQLNDERNPALAERIDALHASGQTVFAAVGSLHMTGPQGLPRLMTQLGYQVERVRFAPL